MEHMTNTTTIDLTLGEALKVVRERGHLTQKEMADRLEIGRNTVVRYESGLTVPRWRDVEAWAEEAGQPAHSLRYYWEVARGLGDDPERPLIAGYVVAA
jgi:transcriptional regulator with XRE-family HTH domain